MKLLKVDTIEIAREKLKTALCDSEQVTIIKKLHQACGYSLAGDIYATEPVPAFRRSTVDGYAVKADNTGGATENAPVFLKIIGEVEMGYAAKEQLEQGQCIYVPTGGMIPEGADAMVMVEYCEQFTQDQIAIYTTVASQAGIVDIGEDMKSGQLVLKRGTTLRPQEIGALAAIGETEILVYAPWKVTIISTGDELISPEKIPQKGQIRDINTYGIQAQAEKNHMEVVDCFVLKDQNGDLKEKVQQALTTSDVVVISGGSSQGKKDETHQIIDEIASEGAFTHGLALKPGKPTIIGYDKPTNTILVGLPGHPAAAMMVFELLISWIQKERTGAKVEVTTKGYLSTNLPGAPGRKTCQLVQLKRREDGAQEVVPIFGKSGMISTLTRADGYILMEENQEGLQKGEEVEVFFI
ncbi:MAG: molybdopterin molybdotransferase MoeA [Lachnospiraceae bacterium]